MRIHLARPPGHTPLWATALGASMRALGALVIMLAMAVPALAADPVPAELFFRRPAVQDVHLSPSGRRLAFTAELQGRVGLFVMDLQTGDTKPTGSVLFTDIDVSRAQWVDDERLVFSVVDLKEGLGEDYRRAPGLYAVRHDGSELRTLVTRFGRAFVTNGERPTSLPWHHVLLHVPTASEDRAGARADEVIVGELSFGDKEVIDITPLWLNTRTGRTRALPTDKSPPYAVRWWFSGPGQPRALVTRREGRDTLHWYRQPRDGEPGRWVKLAEGPQWRLPFQPAWVGTDETLFVEHAPGPRFEQVLAPFDFATGRPGPPRVVTPGFDFDGKLLGNAAGSALLGVRVDTDAEQTVWFDAAHQAEQQRVDAALAGRVNRITCRRCGSKDAVTVVQSFSDQVPGQLLLWNQAAQDGKGAWKVIGNQQPGIDAKRMGTLDLVRIRARDGRDLPVWVTKPHDFQPGQPRPAVVMVHGGPWVRIGHWHWDPMAQFLASRGYVVIEPEFRGSEGYGRAHETAGNKQWGQAMQDDVADALRWAQGEKIAGDKACIVGGSYGGYSALMGLVKDPALYRCGSAWFAVADLMLFVDGGWFVSDDISRSGRQYALHDRVGHPDRDREMLLANSPVVQAARIQAPLQLIYGSDDKRVPLAHGSRLRSAMQKAGLEPEWIVYDGEAHGLRKLENRVDMALKLEAFLARHLK